MAYYRSTVDEHWQEAHGWMDGKQHRADGSSRPANCVVVLRTVQSSTVVIAYFYFLLLLLLLLLSTVQ